MEGLQTGWARPIPDPEWAFLLIRSEDLRLTIPLFLAYAFLGELDDIEGCAILQASGRPCMVEPQAMRNSHPAGWSSVGDIGGPFTLHNGPIFQYGLALPPGEPVRYGFHVEERHCNMKMVCYGGMLASFLDLCLARGATSSLAIWIGAPTMNLSVDYLNPARLGDWVGSRVTVLHRTRQTVSVRAFLLCGAHMLARGSAIYRLPKEEEA